MFGIKLFGNLMGFGFYFPFSSKCFIERMFSGFLFCLKKNLQPQKLCVLLEVFFTLVISILPGFIEYSNVFYELVENLNAFFAM